MLLQGFMIRTRNEGWLQGFVWWTPFTTWTHFFRWDSLATQCGMRRQQDMLSGKKVDVDGTHLLSQPCLTVWMSSTFRKNHSDTQMDWISDDACARLEAHVSVTQNPVAHLFL